MKWVKYYPNNYKYTGITQYRVYEVIEHIVGKGKTDERIIIINDVGNHIQVFRYTIYKQLEFYDVTSEYRNEVIKEILE